MANGQSQDPHTQPASAPQTDAAEDITLDGSENPLAEEPVEELADDAAAAPQDEDLLARIEQLQNETADLRDRLLHALADVENQRRRHERERKEASKYAVSNFARELLVVADQLDMALAAVTQEQRQQNPLLNTMLVGVEATAKQLGEVLGQTGIQRMSPQGAPFDPNYHEVMAEAPGTGQPGGTVVQVIQTGYMIHERLLRPARVIVAKADGDDATAHTIDQSV